MRYILLKFIPLFLLRMYLNFKFFINNFLKKKYKKKYKHKKNNDYKVFNTDIFYGYHDKINLINKKLLCHQKNGNEYFIGFFSDNGEFRRLKNTQLCSWQLGSQLLWAGKDKVLFNCIINDKPKSALYDLNKKKVIKSFHQLIYNIDNSYKKFISINFYDLYKNRSGYGYDLKKYQNDNRYCNQDLKIINIKDGRVLNIIKKNFILKKFKSYISTKFHFNHATFSPSGKTIIFFLVDTENSERKILVFYFNLLSKKLTLIKKINRISHYCWIDNKSILFTDLGFKNTVNYQIYNFLNNKIYPSGLRMKQDGHPMINPKNKNLFVTDTYPNKYGFQKLIVFNLKLKKIIWETELYFSTDFLGKSRCDLHPKWDIDGKKIVIDYAIKNQRFIRVYDYQV